MGKMFPAPPTAPGGGVRAGGAVRCRSLQPETRDSMVAEGMVIALDPRNPEKVEAVGMAVVGCAGFIH